MSTPDICLIVTGAAGFLGRAIITAAKRRSEVGAIIAVSQRSNIVEFEGCQIVPDLRAPETGTGALFQRSVEANPLPQKVLVHCAGHFPEFKPLHLLGDAEIAETLDGNLVSYLVAIKAVLPEMRRRRWGRILAFSSHTAGQSYPFMGLFNLAKAALETAVQTTANENARFGIAANAILIATLKTEIERTIKPTGNFTDWLAPEDVANFALDIALSANPSLNGNALHYWSYSESFFGRSVLDRNSIELSTLDPG